MLFYFPLFWVEICACGLRNVQQITFPRNIQWQPEEVAPSPNRDYFEIRGRGEMQLGILIEEMRREGYEMSLSPPSVVKSTGRDTAHDNTWANEKLLEPEGVGVYPRSPKTWGKTELVELPVELVSNPNK